MTAVAAVAGRCRGRGGAAGRVSSVRYDSPGREDRSNRCCPGSGWTSQTQLAAVNLDGWTLSDEDGRTYTFHHAWLEGRATVRVHTGYGRDTGTDLFQDRRREVWDDRGDTATLRNDRDRFADAVS
ncbi:lamin tail domain-containing protein [Streptomyces sp. NPDC007251]|uniref:lamin tail domain-containing protein n=1 Tax=unclassified Streptomyces TaxID=2593676 RepID=UPI0033D3BB99